MSDLVDQVEERMNRRKTPRSTYGIAGTAVLAVGMNIFQMVQDSSADVQALSERIVTLEAEMANMRENRREENDAFKDLSGKVQDVHDVMVQLRADFRASGISRRDE